MKIAIIYTTVGGTTKECAELLKAELNNHSVELFEIGVREPVIEDFDAVVLGFPIIMGRAYKPARVYLKNHKNELKNAKCAYYICCGFIDCFEEFSEKCRFRYFYFCY